MECSPSFSLYSWAHRLPLIIQSIGFPFRGENWFSSSIYPADDIESLARVEQSGRLVSSSQKTRVPPIRFDPSTSKLDFLLYIKHVMTVAWSSFFVCLTPLSPRMWNCSLPWKWGCWASRLQHTTHLRERETRGIYQYTPRQVRSLLTFLILTGSNIFLLKKK